MLRERVDVPMTERRTRASGDGGFAGDAPDAGGAAAAERGSEPWPAASGVGASGVGAGADDAPDAAERGNGPADVTERCPRRRRCAFA